MASRVDIETQKSSEEALRRRLDRLGWSCITAEQVAAERGSSREVLLKDRLRAALLRLNEWLTRPQADRVIFELENINAAGMAGNRAAHLNLVYGMPLTIDGPRGRESRVVRFFDFDHPQDGLNDFVAASEFAIRLAGEIEQEGRTPPTAILDLVLFVNGLPLVAIDVKPALGRGSPESTALQQVLRYVDTTPGLFHCNLLCAVSMGEALVCVAPGESVYASFRWDPHPLQATDENQADRDASQRDQAPMTFNLLLPTVILDILRDYVVYEADAGRLAKRLPRHHQYRAVTASVRRVIERGEPQDRSGIIAHAAGSDRMSTMMWLATKLRREPRLANPTIVMVTKLAALVEAVSHTFRRSGMPVPERVSNVRDLRNVMADGVGRTAITTLPMLERALASLALALEDPRSAVNLVVIADELSPAEHDQLGASLSQMFPAVALVGFSGPPPEGSVRDVPRPFGNIIDSYSMTHAVADEVLVPVWFESRLPDLAIGGDRSTEQLFASAFGHEDDAGVTKVRRSYFNRETLAEAEQRITMVAADIAEHFKKRVRPNGFKALVLAPSRVAAVRYARCLNDARVRACPMVSSLSGDGPELQASRDIDQDRIMRAFTDPDGEVEILVVVDTLVTPLDAPVQQVLYLDRGLREHEFLQAAARTAHRFSHEHDGVLSEKTYGLVVDYHGMAGFPEEDATSRETDPESTKWPSQGGSTADLETMFIQAESHFGDRDLDDIWECAALFRSEAETGDAFKADEFQSFDVDYRRLCRLMDWVLPDQAALPYVGRLARLTEIRGYVRTLYLSEDSNQYWAGISAKVKRSVEEHIEVRARPLAKPATLSDREFHGKIGELPHDQARTMEMEHALRAFIREHRSGNPTFYDRISRQLDRTSQDMRERSAGIEEGMQIMFDLKSRLLSEGEVAAAHGLSPTTFAIYELIRDEPHMESTDTSFGERSALYRTGDADATAKGLALDVEIQLERHLSVIDWPSNPDVQREMRRDIKRSLRSAGDYNEEDLNRLAALIVDVARHGAET